MLRSLTIENIVLIERVQLALENNLTVLTGETGAGKSILLDALGLVLGNRAEARLVRAGCAQGAVVAEFDLPVASPVITLLTDAGITAEDSLVIRRTLTNDGKSRAFINDTPVTVQLLQTIGEQLVEIHGQHDQRGLLAPANHLEALDRFADATSLCNDVSTHFSLWQHAMAERDALHATLARAQQEQDYLQHVAQELRSLKVQPGEETELASQRSLLQAREKILTALQDALTTLTDRDPALSRIRSAERILMRVPNEVQTKVEPFLQSLDKIGSELQDAQDGLENLLQEMAGGADTLDTIEERLFAIRAAARKYQVTPDELPEFLRTTEAKLHAVEHQESILSALDEKVTATQNLYHSTAKKLTVLREKAASKMSAALAKELTPLKMERAQLQVQITPLEETQWHAGGMERVQFLVSTNPGAPFGPLSKIASGGELSRFMLALKVILSDKNTTPTIIFDEIDTGIGGAVADAVGKRLALLGTRMQVLCVTHQPQVAAQGTHHWRIQKQQSRDSTHTSVQQLSAEERNEELARMLAGENITHEARAAAQQLLAARA